MPKISVLLPLYNVERYIGRCLDSILTQDFQDFEILIVDDASTDNSLRIVEEYRQKDDRIKIIKKKYNEGLMMARKTGYTHAQGDYIFFCDSDDYLPKNILGKLYTRARQTKSDMIVGDIYMKYEKGGGRINHRSSKAGSVEEYKRAILEGTICSLCGILYDANVFKFDYTAFYNQSFSEDRIVLCQLLENIKSISYLNEITYIYFINSRSMTMQRLSNTKLQEQLRALVWCYNWNEHDTGIIKENRKWIIRRLSFYIENNYPVIDEVKNLNFPVKLLTFHEVANYCGKRFALHTYMCQHFKIYRTLSSNARKGVRKVLSFR